MSDRTADAHRRIAEREHEVERRMHAVAPDLSDPKRFAEDARDISRRATEHEKAADRIDKSEE
jgi:hypothetical protein